MPKMTNAQYDTLKWLTLTVSPALVLCIATIGQLFGYDTTLITGIIGAVTLFVDSSVGVAGNQYKKDQDSQQ
jgi:hypothetical protein